MTAISMEFIGRTLESSHAPVRLRDGVFVNELPLVTGVAAGSFARTPRQGPRLPRAKAPQEIRVFVFGESSVEGVPLDANASAPTMLYDMLAARYPGRPVTVVNMGRTASISANTFYYLLASRRYAPDFVIFYMGMNDDPKMTGEQCWPISHPQLHRLWRWLAGRSWVLWSVRTFGPALLWSRGTVEPESRLSQRLCAADPFPEWTRLLVSTAGRTGAGVIVTTPVRNVFAHIDQANEVAHNAGRRSENGLSDNYRRLLQCRLTDGCDAIALAMDLYEGGSTDRDTLPPPEMGDELARVRYPFRSHKMLLDYKANAWKEAVCEHCDYIDFRTSLAQASPHGILAGVFFADEIHLRPEGYFYLARHWYETIVGHVDERLPARPPIPAPGQVGKYYAASEQDATSMAIHYLARGWYLSAIPGLEMTLEHFPDADDDHEAAVALAWLKQKAGMPNSLGAELAVLVADFDPSKRIR